MKWFKREQNVKKKDENSTYLTLENGKVVHVSSDNHKVDKKQGLVEEKPPNPEEIEETPGSKKMRWVWLLFTVLLAYGTIHLYGTATKETKEDLNLQEIQRNVVEKKDESFLATLKNSEEKESDSGSSETSKAGETATTGIVESAENWKEELKGSFTSNKSESKNTSGSVSDDKLFTIRQVDEDGTTILQRIREDSIKYIQGELSRGQYILRLQSTDLKMNRYDQEILKLDSEIPKDHRYLEYMDYVHLKKNGLEELIVELRVVPQERISVTFNNAVDFHNELSKEGDNFFTKELKGMGYKVTVSNGKIKYNKN